MLTETEITIPSGTKETDPVVVEQELPYRVITKVDVQFPDGVGNKTYTASFYGEEQLIPYRKGKWITGESETVSDKPFIDLEESKTVINIRGKSPDANYLHTLIWRISTLPVEVAKWREALIVLASRGRII